MEVDEETHVLIVERKYLADYPGLSNKLEQLLLSDQCKNTSIKDSCLDKDCKFVIYFNSNFTGRVDVDDISGFLTVITMGKYGEFFNLCSASNYATQSLLETAISKLNLNEYWIGLNINSPFFDENVKLFTDSGFGNPVISTRAPLFGENIGYEFIAFKGPVYQPDTYYKAVELRNMFLEEKKEKMTRNVGSKNILIKKPVRALGTDVPNVKAKSPVVPLKKAVVSKKLKGARVIETDPNNIPLSIRRANRVDTFLQNACLNDYFLDGKVIDGQTLSMLDLKTLKERLRESGYISEGTYGVVYKVCNKNRNCDFIIKIQLLGGYYIKNGEIVAKGQLTESNLEDWKKEVDVTLIFNKYGIGSRIVDAWLCANETKVTQYNTKKELFGIFAAEMWSGELKHDECPPKNIIDKLEKQIEKIHSLGYVHGDIFPKNILVKRNKLGLITDATVSDFGLVDTKKNWVNDIQHMKTFYKYHVDKYNSITAPYWNDFNYTRDDFMKDPSIMDRDMIYYYKSKCGITTVTEK